MQSVLMEETIMSIFKLVCIPTTIKMRLQLVDYNYVSKLYTFHH